MRPREVNDSGSRTRKELRYFILIEREHGSLCRYLHPRSRFASHPRACISTYGLATDQM